MFFFIIILHTILSLYASIQYCIFLKLWNAFYFLFNYCHLKLTLKLKKTVPWFFLFCTLQKNVPKKWVLDECHAQKLEVVFLYQVELGQNLDYFQKMGDSHNFSEKKINMCCRSLQDTIRPAFLHAYLLQALITSTSGVNTLYCSKSS